MALTRDDILNAIRERARPADKVDVPEWGGEVWLRRLTAEDIQNTGLSGIRTATVFAKVLAVAITDEEGTPLFTEADVDALRTTDMQVAGRVFTEVMRLNGLLDEQLEEAESVFAQAQPEASSTS